MTVFLKLEHALTSLLLFSLVGVVFMEVVLRAFSSPTTWSVGIAQLLFIWLIFLGANQALREDAHIGVDVLTSLFPRRVQQVIQCIMYVLMVVFLVALIVFGIMMVYFNTGRIIGGTSIGYYFITLSIPIGAFLMLITAVHKVIVQFRSIRHERVNETGGTK
ncbi:TRAP-type C4-dicarboxylate transport system permease small subunit [Alkalihalobacillus xiaoxiensis]|uniref:TRAP-type C4-dicarboxylate transport system permease small subunit n=1 Tax=Shouchella xiaoxiensis TaxID=766895 RepID=A0ABS2SV05_9BACI|nr:TRAP transporter small permease [Shouchella xiaoxiensis]MBM7839378.1 TRAP-type C4-dicarboxylate transport system permease small subunit [Shouchella xiaoxiensis]